MAVIFSLDMYVFDSYKAVLLYENFTQDNRPDQ